MGITKYLVLDMLVPKLVWDADLRANRSIDYDSILFRRMLSSLQKQWTRLLSTEPTDTNMHAGEATTM